MTPQTEDWLDLSNLAALLRDSGDRVLSGHSKLRLSTALLSKLNSAFSSISFLGSNGDFQVTFSHASQSPSIAHLHFLHDFVQKTVGLTVVGDLSTNYLHKSQSVDFTRFRSLQHLELRNCTLSPDLSTNKELQGIRSIRSQLAALVLIQVFGSDDLLWEVLGGKCVSIRPELIWAKLSQLVVSYCRLKTLGCSLSLACNLQWLDVSHNILSNADAISSSLTALPNLCYLNLSFNRLTKIPIPSNDVSCPISVKIQVLLLSHNYIENLEGLQHLTCLRELNLEVNQLHSHSSLQQLRTLHQLQHLKLKGNPISFHKRYRILAAASLPPRAVFVKFMLDGRKLNEAELLTVKDGPLPFIPTQSDHVSVNMSVQSSNVAESSTPSNSGMDTSFRKSRRAREVIIEDFDTLEELNDRNFTQTQNIGSIESSGEHLQTKRQLENVRSRFKEDWLRAHAGSTVQELLGLNPSGPCGSSVASISSSAKPLSNSTPIGSPGSTVRPTLYPANLDEQLVLESIISQRSPTRHNPTDMSQTTQSSQYLTANDSDTVLHVSTGHDETLLKEEGALLGSFAYDADVDDDPEEVIEHTPPKENEDSAGEQSTFLAKRIVQNQVSLRDIFLVITSRYIKEMDVESGAVLQSWRLHSLNSCVLLSAVPCHVQLCFKTVVPSKKERIYEMDLVEAQKQLLPSLKAILETQSLNALNVAAFQCMGCSGAFSVELDSRRSSRICPTCGSTLVFELDEAPLPSLASSSPSPLKAQFSSTAEPATVAEQSLELLHSPSDSSIGSAFSLESPGSVIQAVSDHTPSINPSMRRCESDIDIISNPSQSSIEILDDASRSSGTPGRKRSSEERQVVAIPSLVTVPEVSNPLSPLPAGLTESSSSGSITDSVCTAYENSTGTGGMSSRRGAHGLAKSVLKEESSRENSPFSLEKPSNMEPATQSTPLSDVFNTLLQTVTSKISASEASEKKLRKENTVGFSSMQYNYVDFSSVDHRLKLHLHMSILDADEREFVVLLLRGEILTCAPKNRYQGILLISSHKVYVMKITGPEENDAVDRWISRTIALPLEKLSCLSPLPFGFGIALNFQASSVSHVIVVVRDQLYCKNLFTFLANLPDKPGFLIETSPSEKHCQAVKNILEDVVRSALLETDTSFKTIVLLRSVIVSKDELVSKEDGRGLHYGSASLILTSTSLLLYSDDLMWLFPSEISRAKTLKCIEKQPISNLILVKSIELELCFQFLDELAGIMETWRITVESDAVQEEILESIRAPWEELFSVPLQVNKKQNVDEK